MSDLSGPYTMEIPAQKGRPFLNIALACLILGLGVVSFYAAGHPGVKAHALKLIAWLATVIGGLWFVFACLEARRNAPWFYGDRTGFRIRGGQLRPWADLLNTDVRDVRSKHHVNQAQQLRIRLSYDALGNWCVVGRFSYSGGAERLANHLILFKVKMEKLIDRNAERRIGAASVVAARGYAEAGSLMCRMGRFVGGYLA